MGCLEDCEAVQCGWGGSDWRKAGAERGRWGLFHTCKCILCSVSNAGPLKIFKKTRLEEENKAAGKQGWLLQQWSRCRMTWT